MEANQIGKEPISRKAKDSIAIMLIGIVGSLFYSLLDGDINNFSRMFSGALIGLMGSGFIALNEVWFSKSVIRHLKFTTLLIYKSILYTTFFILLIVLVLSFERSVERDVSWHSYLSSTAFMNFLWKEDLHVMIIYSLSATVSFILVYQISRKMGQGVLWNFVSGKYHKPREEERIFMFMDITNSTSLAEDLGDIEYNKLLNDFFFDITESIIKNYGEIYRYVGDEVVVSWRPNKGLKNAHCIRTFFDAKKAIHLNRENYLKSYGLVPTFTAGYHIGKIIVGEIGEVKSQISFIGNVMYETTEIEKSCKRNQVDNLISESLMNMIELPSIYNLNKKGNIKTSESNTIQLFSISEK